MTQTPLRSLLRWALCFSAISLIGTTGMAGEKRSSSDKRFVLVSSFQSQAPSNDANEANSRDASVVSIANSRV